MQDGDGVKRHLRMNCVGNRSLANSMSIEHNGMRNSKLKSQLGELKA